MEKKLPSVFVNSNANNINGNNKKVYYSFYDDRKSIINKKYNSIDIRKKINEVFSKSDFNYKVKALITYKDGEEMEEVIVSKNYNYLLNIEGKRIFIDDIVDINWYNYMMVIVEEV